MMFKVNQKLFVGDDPRATGVDYTEGFPYSFKVEFKVSCDVVNKEFKCLLLDHLRGSKISEFLDDRFFDLQWLVGGHSFEHPRM